MGVLYGAKDQSDWWDVAFEMGRAPFDSKFCAARRAAFGSFAPIGRGMAPAYRQLSRGRAGRCKATLRLTRKVRDQWRLQLGVSSAELGYLLRSYVEEIPQS